MKIGYLILAHNNLVQLALLVNLLTFDTEDNFCFIHIDKKIWDVFEVQKMTALIITDKFKILNSPTDIVWGGFSMVSATMDLINCALTCGVPFDYLSLHSGEDLPIKSNFEVNEYLKKNFGKQFVDNFEINEGGPWSGNGGLDRLNYNWFIDDVGFSESRRLVDIQKEIGFKKIRPLSIKVLFGGSQWWTLTLDCVKYVISMLEDDDRILEFFKYSYIPDETVFPTLILNSPFGSKVSNFNLRFIDWKTGPSFPKVFTQSDALRLFESKALFARKFNANINYNIIKTISSRLLKL